MVQASLPTGVFAAFGLKPLDGSKTATAPQTLKPLSPNEESEGSGTPPTIPERETDKPEVERDPPVIQQFIKKLDDWKNNGVLGQGEANKIRGWINTHLMHSINWEAELLRSVNLHVAIRDTLHLKGLLGQDYYLSGSMNLTYNGVEINHEGVSLNRSPEAIAEARIHFQENYEADQ